VGVAVADMGKHMDVALGMGTTGVAYAVAVASV